MFDVFSSDSTDTGADSGSDSTFLSALTGIADAASTAYSTYSLSQAGITPIPGQPGAYVQQAGSTAHVITPVQDSQSKSVLLLGFFALAGLLAFKAIK